MNTTTEETNIEQMEVMKQLMELLEQQNMQGQAQDMKEIFQYMAGMQLQLGIMAEELHNVKDQLAQATDNKSVPLKKKLTKQAEQLEGKMSGLLEKLTEIKDHLINTATQALHAFKENGQQGIKKALNTGISGVQKMLSSYRNKLSETLVDFEKTANQIDSIGDELKQIGNSTANVGRLIAGKGTKEVSEEKPGVTLTRITNAPIKRHISNLKSGIEKTGNMCEKLEQMSEKLEPKEAERTAEKKAEKVSVKDKLAQMKVKSEQQIQSEKVNTKVKEQAVSI